MRLIFSSSTLLRSGGAVITTIEEQQEHQGDGNALGPNAIDGLRGADRSVRGAIEEAELLGGNRLQQRRDDERADLRLLEPADDYLLEHRALQPVGKVAVGRRGRVVADLHVASGAQQARRQLHEREDRAGAHALRELQLLVGLA